MIAKEALNLVKRLNDLKNSENKEPKQLKTLIQSITDYQSKSKKMFTDLNEKISGVEDELKIIRDYEKSEQEAAVKKVDEFQQSLKQLLQSYQSEANQANKKLEYMVETVKEQLKVSFKQNIKIERSNLNRIHNVINKVESLIQTTRQEQKQSIDHCQRIRNTIRTKSNHIMQLHHQHTEQIIKDSQQILIKIQELQSKFNNQVDLFSLKKQSKTYEANRMINLMIQQATNN